MFTNQKLTRNVLLCLAMLLLAAPQTVFAQQRRGGGPGQINPSDFQFDPGKRNAVVPFTLVGNAILVQASVNGSQPMWMIFDTGSSTTAVNSRMAAQLGLNARPAATVSLPGLTASNLALTPMSLDARAQALGHDVEGVLGSSFIRGWVVAIDYAAHTLTFYDARSYPAPNGPGSLPLVEVSGNEYVAANLSLTGNDTVSGLFQINTGSNETLSLIKRFADAQGVLSKIPPAQTMAMGGGTSTDARISRLLVGAYTLKQPVISILEDNAGAPEPPADTTGSTNGTPSTQPAPQPGSRGNRRRRGNPSDQGTPVIPANPAARIDRRAAIQTQMTNAVAGVIGSGILRRFTVILDYQARVMSLRPNASLNVPFEADMSGMDLRATSNGTGYTVTSVRPGFPAATAGLATGDLIVAVDGNAAAGIGQNALEEMFKQAGKNYTLTVRRGNNNAQVQLTMQRVI